MTDSITYLEVLLGNTAFATITGFSAEAQAKSPSDDFSSTSVNTDKWNIVTTGTTATVSEGGGDLEISLTASGTGGDYQNVQGIVVAKDGVDTLEVHIVGH